MIRWLTTKPSGKAHTVAEDDGVTGWKLHAVESGADTISYKVSFADVRYVRALCGLLPRHGWGLDLFIEDKCKRCEAKAKEL